MNAQALLPSSGPAPRRCRHRGVSSGRSTRYKHFNRQEMSQAEIVASPFVMHRQHCGMMSGRQHASATARKSACPPAPPSAVDTKPSGSSATTSGVLCHLWELLPVYFKVLRCTNRSGLHAYFKFLSFTLHTCSFTLTQHCGRHASASSAAFTATPTAYSTSAPTAALGPPATMTLATGAAVSVPLRAR